MLFTHSNRGIDFAKIQGFKVTDYMLRERDALPDGPKAAVGRDGEGICAGLPLTTYPGIGCASITPTEIRTRKQPSISSATRPAQVALPRTALWTASRTETSC